MRFIHETLEDEGKETAHFKEQGVQLPPQANPTAVSKVANRRNFIHHCYHDESNPRPCKREEF